MSSDQAGNSWRYFLDLGEEILRKTNVQDQADVICMFIQRDSNYQVDIWLDEVVSRVPGQHNLSLFPSIPQSPIMQKALETRSICYIGKSNTPKTYTKKETAYTLAIPLIVQDILLGVLQIIRLDGSPITQEEAGNLEGLSAHAAVSLHVSHQTIIKNWRLEQLSLVRAVSSKIANSQSLDELAQQVTRQILEAFHYYAVSVFTIDPGSKELKFRACSCSNKRESGTSPVIAAQLGKGIVGYVAEHGLEVLANDVSRDPRFVVLDQLPLTQAEVVFPLKVEDRILGVLDIQSDHIYAFHEMDMMVLRSLADNIALAVEGAWLYAGLQRRVDELATVAEVGRALSSILDFNQLLQQVVDIIFEKFHYPYVHLFLVQPDISRVVFQAGAGERSKKLIIEGLDFSMDDQKGIIPWVARNGKTLIANDVEHERIYRKSNINPSGTSSEMAIPLIFANEVLGVLDIQSDQKNVFDDEVRFLFEALADTIAISIRNSKLYNAEKWRRQASDSLREVAGLLSSNMELSRLLEIILVQMERILPCDAASIWLVNDSNYQDFDQSTSLDLAAVHGVDPAVVRETYLNNIETTSWLNKALFAVEPTVRSDEDPMEPIGWSQRYINNYSAIAAPLKVGSQPLGILVLVHKTNGRYGIESVQMTSAFASYAAVAIQNARLYSTAQEQAWVSTVLLQVAEATRTLSSIDELLKSVVRLTPMLVGIKGFGVFLWESNIERFILNGSHGLQLKGGEVDALYIVRPGEASALDQMLEIKNPIFIDDLDSGIPFITLDRTDEDNIKIVLLPLISRGSVLGACLVAYTNTDNNNLFDPMENEKLAIIQGIAHQTAIAVENIKLLESQQQETYISAALLQVAQTVVSHNDLKDLYASIVQITPILVGSEICLIYIWDEEMQSFHLVESNGIKMQALEDSNQIDIYPEEFPFLEQIYKSEEMRVLPIGGSKTDDLQYWATLQVSDDSTLFNFELNNDPLLIGIPLSVKNEFYGILLIKDPGTDKMYLQKRLEILSGIAQQTSLAIQNDRLQSMAVVQERLEREFQIAREIQQTFLPSELPQYPGWKLDVRWRPAREVGGDFYDVFQLSHDRLAILVADVTDKGMSAALYMTVTRTLLRTVSQQLSTPAEILDYVNELLLRDTPHGMYITAFFGLLDLKTGVLFYANAGHNLPICKSSTGKLEKLKKGGMPLGIIEGLTLQNHEINLEFGDTLILFTDGVTEASTSTDFFGDHRLEEAILKAKDQEPETILDEIDEALIRFQKTEIPSDDVTVLALHHCEKKRKS